MCVIHLMPIYVFAGHKSWTCCSPHGRVSQSQLPLIRLQQGNAKSWKRTTSRPRKRDLPRHPKCRFYGFSVPSLSLFGAQKKVEKGTAKKNSHAVDQWKLRHHTVVYLQCSLASLKPPWFPSHCCDHKDVPRHQRWSSCEARTWVSLWQAAGPEFYRLGRL